MAKSNQHKIFKMHIKITKKDRAKNDSDNFALECAL